MNKHSKISDPKKWKKISDQDNLYEGEIIKGFTYNPGDYHYKNEGFSKKLLGDAKLRVGVIIKKYSNNIFKVQFRNSAAKKPEKSNITNEIKVFDKKDVKVTTIQGTDSYCMFIQRKKIKLVFRPVTHINNLEELNKIIFKKHHKNKKRVQRKIEAGRLFGKRKEIVRNIFNNDQFTNKEKNLLPSKALEKINLILTRHSAAKINLKIECVYKEKVKVQKAEIWAKELIDSINLKKEIDSFYIEASDEEAAADFIRFVEKSLEENKISETIAVRIGNMTGISKPLNFVTEILLTLNKNEEILKLFSDFKNNWIRKNGNQLIIISDSKLFKLFENIEISKNKNEDENKTVIKTSVAN